MSIVIVSGGMLRSDAYPLDIYWQHNILYDYLWHPSEIVDIVIWECFVYKAFRNF